MGEALVSTTSCSTIFFFVGQLLCARRHWGVIAANTFPEFEVPRIGVDGLNSVLTNVLAVGKDFFLFHLQTHQQPSRQFNIKPWLFTALTK